VQATVLDIQWCLPLCNCSPPGPSVHGIPQTRILEWVAISSSRGSSWCRNWTVASCIVGRFFTVWATREAPQNSDWKYTKCETVPFPPSKNLPVANSLFHGNHHDKKNGSHLQAFPAPPRLSCLIPPHKVFWFSLICCFSKKKLCPVVTWDISDQYKCC